MIEVSQAWVNGEMTWENTQDDIAVNVHYIFGLEQDLDSDSLYAMHAIYYPNSQRWDYRMVNRWFRDKQEEPCPFLHIFVEEIGKQLEIWFDHSIEARIKNIVENRKTNKQVL
ncbi:hypothetical protein [Ectobacillus panaciterrae]|uniref:hypothetical protein n=1 Tax=Ectobacillus panaciterrae TaxID=363872 RepID=UPI0004276B8F|nr:hypothetical protein [Ectobacillus panaciterrae]